MASFKSFANRPWHGETSFERVSRLNVGTTCTDHISVDVWSACRNEAESVILAHLLDEPRPLRMMLNRIPGELIPQYGKIKTDGQYVHTLLVPNLVTTPTSLMPTIWKNLTGYYEDRWNTDPLTYTTDYTISGNNVTIKAASEGDVYTIEYETTLNTVPTILQTLSIWKTHENVLNSKYGTDHARTVAWAETYGKEAARMIEGLQGGDMEIAEFARIRLYADWDEWEGSIGSIPMARV